MRQTIGFHATQFDCLPVEFEIPDGEEPPEPGTEPAAMMRFVGGENIVLNIPISIGDAEGMMGAFTQAEPMRQQLPPEAINWQPPEVGLPQGMFWELSPELVGMSVTPPQQMEGGLVPHWTLAFQDADDSQVQVAVSDAICVRIIRALAQVANGELTAEEPADAE